MSLGKPPDSDPRIEAEGTALDLYVVNVNFDATAILPDSRLESDSKIILLFGYDPQEMDGVKPIITPFPMGKTPGHERLNNWLTDVLRPEYARSLQTEEERLRFPSFHEMAPYLNPYMRHEMGYSLLILAEEEPTEAGRPEGFERALRNMGNIFLMSTGVYWNIEPEEQQTLTEIYSRHFEQVWGPAPSEVKDQRVKAADIWLRVMKDTVEVKYHQDWPDIADLGHGLEYMMLRVAKRGGKDSFQILATGGGIPPNYGTPIGASYDLIRISSEAA